MLRFVLICFFLAFSSSAQIVDENSLVAKPKAKKNTTIHKPKTTTTKTPAPSSSKKVNTPKTSSQIKPVKSATTTPVPTKTAPAPQQSAPQQPKPTLQQTPPPPKAISTKPAPDSNLKLSPAPKEEIPPLSEEDLKKESSKDSTPENSLTLEDERPKFKNRKAWTVDYNTWYEMLIIKDKTTSTYGESKSHYFGVGFYYDYTVYEEKFGYAGSIGFITGNAQAGTINTGEYYERRVSWMGYRAGGRLFVRANNRIDIGPSLIIQYKDTKWPEESNYKVMSQANPQYFMYIDTRWRISYPLELIQSFGAHTRQYALVWRLGINYTFN